MKFARIEHLEEDEKFFLDELDTKKAFIKERSKSVYTNLIKEGACVRKALDIADMIQRQEVIEIDGI